MDKGHVFFDFNQKWPYKAQFEASILLLSNQRWFNVIYIERERKHTKNFSSSSSSIFKILLLTLTKQHTHPSKQYHKRQAFIQHRTPFPAQASPSINIIRLRIFFFFLFSFCTSLASELFQCLPSLAQCVSPHQA